MPDTMTVIREIRAPRSALRGAPGAATYRTIIGDDTGEGLPIRTGIQTSSRVIGPGAFAPLCRDPDRHFGARRSVARWRPGIIALEPGVTVVLPADRPHAFRVVGDEPLVTLGIHTFGQRIVNYKDEAQPR